MRQIPFNAGISKNIFTVPEKKSCVQKHPNSISGEKSEVIMNYYKSQWPEEYEKIVGENKVPNFVKVYGPGANDLYFPNFIADEKDNLKLRSSEKGKVSRGSTVFCESMMCATFSNTGVTPFRIVSRMMEVKVISESSQASKSRSSCESKSMGFMIDTSKSEEDNTENGQEPMQYRTE